MEEDTVDETEGSPQVNILDVIKDFPNAPTQAIIDEWKAKYGDIFFSGFSEKECYIFRALNRKEYRQIQIDEQLMASKKEPQSPTELEVRVREVVNAKFDQEETVVEKCLLWPKLNRDELSNKAGTVSTLMEQISANSNFTTPQQAQMLVVKL